MKRKEKDKRKEPLIVPHENIHQFPMGLYFLKNSHMTVNGP